MRKNVFSMIAFAMMMLLSGCDKLNEATSRDFKANNIQFDFTATAVDDVTTSSASQSTTTSALPAGVTALSAEQAVTTRAAATTSFSVTRTVDIAELNNADVIKYANKIKNVMANSSTVTVTTVPSGDYTVTGLTITAEGVPGSIVIPSYTIGGAFTAPADMNAFTAAFILKLLDVRSISVTVQGQTDAPAGTTININYKNDIVCTANLL